MLLVMRMRWAGDRQRSLLNYRRNAQRVERMELLALLVASSRANKKPHMDALQMQASPKR
jgi:hypothetical protein